MPSRAGFKRLWGRPPACAGPPGPAGPARCSKARNYMASGSQPAERESAVRIRPATPADLPAIAVIQDAAPDAAHWPVSDYLAYDCSVAETAGRIVGFLVCRSVAPGEREILNLAVSPEFRRRGVARALLQRETGNRNAVHFLEVRASNLTGRNFYRCMGFTEAGVRTSYYDNPPESGIVMKRDS